MWSYEDGMNLEVAEWVLGSLIARISKQLAAKPDEAAARALQEQRAALAAERRRMVTGGPAAVERVLREYGPQARKLRES
jgi:hypothetical protein